MPPSSPAVLMADAVVAVVVVDSVVWALHAAKAEAARKTEAIDRMEGDSSRETAHAARSVLLRACISFPWVGALRSKNDHPRRASKRLRNNPKQTRRARSEPLMPSFPSMARTSKDASGAEAPLTVVYVEDDERLARLTSQYLASHEVEVVVVPRGDLALAEVLRVRPDVVLLDLMLPGVGGLDVCRSLRERVDVPIIMVTARNEEADRVMGLEGGADDYVTKPFSSRELLARIRAHARRGRGRTGPRAPRLEVGGLVVDAATMSATMRGEPLPLTTFEFAILRVLAERVGQVLSREQLLVFVHGAADEAFDRSIDVHISRLRHKLQDDPRNPKLLKTIRGVGYMLTPGER
jgi:DNA-binding response OmpR family regulator